ncbi:DNA-binding transcriptional regulator YhcF (GntR family) [Streptomyces ambofaciens]
MENTWADRDLPVLDAIVRYLDQAAGASLPELRDIAEQTDLEIVEVGKAALALESDRLIEIGKTAGGHGTWYVKRVSGEARRLVGQWPTAEQFVDELAQRLQAAADEEPDPERRGRLRELASSAGDVARNVFVDVATSVISRQMGA